MDGATLSPETLGEVRVQRDMDLVRRIMKEIRLRSDIRARPVEIDGVDPVVLGRHVEMLFKAGLVEGTPHASSGRPYTQVLVRDLSWAGHRSEEHPSELQSLMRISYDVYCLKKKN